MPNTVLPPECYTQEKWLAFEWGHIFRKLWIFARLTQQLKNENERRDDVSNRTDHGIAHARLIRQNHDILRQRLDMAGHQPRIRKQIAIRLHLVAAQPAST